VRTEATGAGPARLGVLVMAHGTPRSLDDLPAFYTEIRRGQPPPPELLAELEARYRAIGGTSPLNELTRAQIAGVDRALERRAPGRFEVVGGAKFAPPRIEDAAEQLTGRGLGRVIGLVLAPHSSRLSVGEYERRARQALAGSERRPGVELDMIDHWYDEPGFVTLVAERVRSARDAFDQPSDIHVLFTAHSVPERVVEAGDTYPDQLEQSARLVAEAAGLPAWSVAWQSAGRTAEPWLGPDVNDAITDLAATGVAGVLVCPIGFVSDHLEVLYDLDIEAAATARRCGIAFARTASLNDDPRLGDVLAGAVLSAAACP
jgi:protoporphyrin/coproporphyrin ferrochelatase